MPHPNDLLIDGPIGRLSVRTKGLEPRPRQVVVLVQGSNLTGQSMFDFSFPGGEDYSVMDALVAEGFGAIAFAIRGYGRSDPPEDGFSVTTETAMEDLDAVIAWTAAQGWPKPHVLAFSWGGRIAGRWAETHGGRIGRLVLYDPARGGGNVILPAPTEPWWTNTREHYAEKLEPEFTSAELRNALGDHVVGYESRSPNGIRLENATPVTPINPAKITNPTLLIYGVEAAKATYMKGGLERAEFFEQLASDDKAFVILPGGGDFIHFQQGRHRFFKAVAEFLRAG
ncbi:alpha/beta hydrolase [Phenylobacterium aquaticum]|uniref:alpha/beta hydrolase n=1 Tax=Phenylobacterium aquaticum TaxID=1763816 RepID=UPI0026F1CACC|nr:alpha/beta fold hydrolase [Phenylobacterium aquaticum]